MRLLPWTREPGLRFDMFEVGRHLQDARRAQKLASLYHRGQDLAWDGREVLAELVGKHGGITFDPARREALAAVFGVIMWGELAAWRISAQLADRIVELEPKMAATSQAHDEARHFYVMHDYLAQLGYVPMSMDRASRGLLEMVLGTHSLAEKLVGMQLMVEPLALTIFQAVRESRVEPVLADLLAYYEKDEARHVGLGVQLLPEMVKRMSRPELLKLTAFQVRVVGWAVAGLRSLAPHLRAIGIDPRRVMLLGRAKQMKAFEQLWEGMGGERSPLMRQVISRSINAVCEVMFPDDGDRRGTVERAKHGWGQPLVADAVLGRLDPDANAA